MSSGNPEGPAWLGIGAQRSGTTWFTDLLVQHPEVTLGRSGRKELHAFNRALIDEPTDYLAEFRGLPGKPGEFTPAYLRMPWVPDIARQLCRLEVVLVVLLRDPVVRFESAIRLFLDRQRPRRRSQLPEWLRDKGVDATWAGMYATQLDSWKTVFPRDQLVVLQYERVVDDATAATSHVWAAMGLEPVALANVGEPSRTSTDADIWSLRDHPDLRERLIGLYRSEVDRVVAEWDLDRSLWSHFA